MGRRSALRVALEGGERSRRSNDADAENLQQGRREWTTPSCHVREPAQPRESSPLSRPPSVRSRSGGLAILSSRRRCSDSRIPSNASTKATTAPRAEKAEEGRGSRSSTYCFRKTSIGGSNCEASGAVAGKRSAGRRSSSYGGNCSDRDESSHVHGTPTRRRPQTAAHRAAYSPSASMYLDQENLSHARGHSKLVSRERRRISNEEQVHRDSTDHVVQPPLWPAGHSAGTAKDPSPDGRAGGRAQPAPSTAPSALEINHLPFIDSLDISGEEPRGQNASRETDPPQVRIGCHGENANYRGLLASTASSRSTAAARRHRELLTSEEETPRHHSTRNRSVSESSSRGGSGCIHDRSVGDRASETGDGTTRSREALAGNCSLEAVMLGNREGRSRSLQLGGEVPGNRCSFGGATKQSPEVVGEEAEPATAILVQRKGCLVGLQNLGNTCFMNACLQCLLHTETLVDLFRQRVHEQRLYRKSPTQGALAQAFGELVQTMEASQAYSHVSPTLVSVLVRVGSFLSLRTTKSVKNHKFW